jgi:GNAT superfamily N-acetyltransferase
MIRHTLNDWWPRRDGMAELVTFVPDTHEADLRALLTAYLEEGATGLKQAFDFEQDIPAAVDGMMGHLAQFAPPAGRLLLAIEGNTVLGCGALRPIAPGVAEIKRMYLRPEARGRGLGRQLLEALLAASRQEGYQQVRLDTDGLMPAAVRLYRTAGFVPCDPYPESEIPVEFHDRWLFMRRDLTAGHPAS